MAQIFSRRAHTLIRFAIVAVVVFICAAGWALHAVFWSPYTTRVNVPIPQPVPFSHKHHVGDIGIDCRYCHGGVEKSAFAGLPASEVCMTCHSQVFNTARALEPVRQSLIQNKPVVWNRVHKLPDFVYFDHSIHVNKGVGCVTCHGNVDEMPMMWKSQTLFMKWCLECHRHPEANIRPTNEVFNLHWTADKTIKPQWLMQQNGIQTNSLQDCGICHR